MHTTIAPSGLANLCRCEFKRVPLLDVTESVNSCTSAATATQVSTQSKERERQDGANRHIVVQKATHRHQTRRSRGWCARTRGRCARRRGGPARRSPSSRARPSHSSACAIPPPTPAPPQALLRFFPHHPRRDHHCYSSLARGWCEQYETPTTQSPLGHRSTSRQLSVSSSTTPPSSAAKQTSHSSPHRHLHLHLHLHYSSQPPPPRKNCLVSESETPNEIKTSSESREAVVSPGPDARQ